MPSQIIQNYLNDTTIPKASRQKVMEDMNNGVADQSVIESAINLKYGNKYSSNPTISSVGKSTGIVQQAASAKVPGGKATVISSSEAGTGYSPLQEKPEGVKQWEETTGKEFPATPQQVQQVSAVSPSGRITEGVETAKEMAEPGFEMVSEGMEDAVNLTENWENLTPQERWHTLGSALVKIPGGTIETLFGGALGAAIGVTKPELKVAGEGVEAIADFAVEDGANKAKAKIGELTTLAVNEWDKLDPDTKLMIRGVLDIALPKLGKTVVQDAKQLGMKAGREALEGGLTGAKTGLALGDEAAVAIGSTAKQELDALKNALTKTPEQILQETNTVIDNAILKAIKPTIKGKKTVASLEQYQSKARSAVNSIIDNKENLVLLDDVGESVVLPDSLKTFSDAISQTKKKVFNEYDSLLKEAGDTGVSLNTLTIADDLANVKKSSKWAVIEDNFPEVVKYVDDKISILKNRKSYTLEQAQEVIKAYNNSLEAFYRNPSPEGFGKVTVDAMIVNNMRKNLDELINATTGEQYQALKAQYGALREIEEDVAKRFIIDAKKNQKGLVDFTDVFSAGDIVAGLTTGNPAFLLKGAAQKTVVEWFKSINNPNNIIKKMFNNVNEAKNKMSDISSKVAQ